jgi:TolA-binding protein
MMADIEANIGPNARQRGCPPPERLSALAGDALPDDPRREVSAHLARCVACQALAADLARLDEAELPANLEARVVTAPDTRARWALLVAAVVLAAIGLSAWWRVHGPKQMEADRQELALGESPTAAPSAPAPAPRWTIEKPALVLPAATVLVMRGSDPAAAALTTALQAYRKGDYTAAVMSLAAFTATHPDSADGWFYLGASRLLTDADTDARTALERAASLGAGASHPELEWLRATAEARTGATDSAKTRLTALCDASGALKDRACEALRSISP